MIQASLLNFTVSMAKVLDIDIEGMTIRQADEAVERALQARLGKSPAASAEPDPEPGEPDELDLAIQAEIEADAAEPGVVEATV